MEPGTEPQHKVTPSLADDSGCIAIASPPKDPNPNIATFPEETDCISSPNIGPDNANAELTRDIVTSATNESTLVTEVRQLLDDPQYIESSQGNYGNAMEVLIQHGQTSSFWQTRKPMIERANALGGATSKMKVVSSDDLISVMRLPHSNENMAVDALDVVNEAEHEHKNTPLEFFFFSHRWLRNAHPDTEDHEKARALVEFVKYRKKWTKHQRGIASRIYFWIDISCVDQNNPGEDLAKLPLWVACCSHMVTFTTTDYFSRAWCRLEQLLASGFIYSDHQCLISAGYTNNTRPGTYVRSTFHSLEDPAQGLISFESDRDVIRRLAKHGVEAVLRRKRGGAFKPSDDGVASSGDAWPTGFSFSGLKMFDLTTNTNVQVKMIPVPETTQHDNSTTENTDITDIITNVDDGNTVGNDDTANHTSNTSATPTADLKCCSIF
eukprot:m.183507 g.183507  ORF g.183507 m.183507 type:complete len:438 (-) comp32162_c0_seq6:232-1545(-)